MRRAALARPARAAAHVNATEPSAALLVRSRVLRHRRVLTFGGTLLACVPAGATAPATPVETPALDVTLDTTEPLLIEDDARRRAIPPEVMRRRVYDVERIFHRWHPPARPPARPHTGLRLQPLIPPTFPADRVALRGYPAPKPGERFVVFGEAGRLGVVEVTEETCPSGAPDCIVCADDDRERRHWARILEREPGFERAYLALGPFAPDEPLPSPRQLDLPSVPRGRWKLSFETDFDGDGAPDRAFASGDCHPDRPCERLEYWRLHDGRWYAEPRDPPAPRAPMHLLTPEHWNSAWLSPERVSEQPTGGPRHVIAAPSDIDLINPKAGDYWILTTKGVVGHATFAEDHPRDWCSIHGPMCHEAEVTDLRPHPRGSRHFLAGPIPNPGVAVRKIDLPKRPRYFTRWDPNRSTEELALELTDGTRWTVTSRPCLADTPDEVLSGTCLETQIDRPGAPPHRHINGLFYLPTIGITSLPVCRSLP